MSMIGQIESTNDPNGIDKNKWNLLVSLHSALVVPPRKKGINPFTGGVLETPLSTTTAIIRVNEVDAGLLYWAMDGSPMLIVASNEGCHELVAPIADEIARTVGGRLTWEWYD